LYCFDIDTRRVVMEYGIEALNGTEIDRGKDGITEIGFMQATPMRKARVKLVKRRLAPLRLAPTNMV
jgi:hypothetical protein